MKPESNQNLTEQLWELMDSVYVFVQNVAFFMKRIHIQMLIKNNIARRKCGGCCL